MPCGDSAESAGAFWTHYATALVDKGKNESAGFSESLDAVVDYDGDRADGDGHRCHPGQDGADAAQAIIDHGSDHEISPRGGV